MMSCSLAYRRKIGPRSSQVRRMFLNTGCISEKCACNVTVVEIVVERQHPDTFSRPDLFSSLSTRIPTTRRP